MTYLVDNDGDTFQMAGGYSVLNVPLDRDKTSVFKLEFAVNKNLALPATVRIGGYIDNRKPLDGATFQIR